MSTSEQEIRSEVAEMRQAIVSAAVSRRRARYVSVCAVIVGLLIVLFFLNLLRGLVVDIQENPEGLQAALTQQLETLGLERKAEQVLRAAAPAYWEETQKALDELDLPQVASEQLQELVEELRPVLEQEIERVRPTLEVVLDAQAKETAAELQDLLQQKLGDRFADMIGAQQDRLGEQTGLTEDDLRQLVETLRDASGEALLTVLERRAGDLEVEIGKMDDLLAQIPGLPEREQDAVAEDLFWVLIGLLRENLPVYVFEDAPATPRAPALPAVMPRPAPLPAEALEAAEAARKAAEEGRKRAEEARKKGEEARKAAMEAAGVDPAAPPADLEERIEAAKKAAEEAQKRATQPTTMGPEARAKREEGLKKAAEAAAKAAEEAKEAAEEGGQ